MAPLFVVSANDNCLTLNHAIEVMSHSRAGFLVRRGSTTIYNKLRVWVFRKSYATNLGSKISRFKASQILVPRHCKGVCASNSISSGCSSDIESTSVGGFGVSTLRPDFLDRHMPVPFKVSISLKVPLTYSRIGSNGPIVLNLPTSFLRAKRTFKCVSHVLRLLFLSFPLFIINNDPGHTKQLAWCSSDEATG